VSAGVDEARALARKALELLLAKYAGALTEEERKEALKGLERLFPEEFLEEELERLEEEGRLRWALRKAFIPPPWLRSPREGAETRVSRNKRNWARIERKVRKFAANPSLFKDLCLLAFKLAERGYLARVRVIRVRDLALAKLLPPFLLRSLSEKIVRLELEVYPLTSPRAHSYL
jgi:hypothetical protein